MGTYVAGFGIPNPLLIVKAMFDSHHEKFPPFFGNHAVQIEQLRFWSSAFCRSLLLIIKCFKDYRAKKRT